MGSVFRRAEQTKLVKLGVLEWILGVLGLASQQLGQVDQHLSSYTVEYGVALVMNLVMRSAGRRRCESRRVDALGVLCSLLSYPRTQTRSCVHGALFGLFSSRVLRERAWSLDIPELLRDVQGMSTPQDSKQLDFVLQRLTDQSGQSFGADSDDEQDPHRESAQRQAQRQRELRDDAELLQEDMVELEEDEIARVGRNLVRGEQLLTKEYALTASQTMQRQRREAKHPNGGGRSHMLERASVGMPQLFERSVDLSGGRGSSAARRSGRLPSANTRLRRGRGWSRTQNSSRPGGKRMRSNANNRHARTKMPQVRRPSHINPTAMLAGGANDRWKAAPRNGTSIANSSKSKTRQRGGKPKRPGRTKPVTPERTASVAN